MTIGCGWNGPKIVYSCMANLTGDDDSSDSITSINEALNGCFSQFINGRQFPLTVNNKQVM
jgi:hypothetical protein